MGARSLLQAAALAAFATLTAAQTYTDCDPLSESCPADTALGKSIAVDFTSGESSQFTASGSPTYGSNGAVFTISKSGDSPLLTSNWYIMFGKVEFTVKAAPGTGIVSSCVLQSDDLDEIDWEWLGAYNGEVQTNYFGKGDTSTYDRGTTVSFSGTQDDFHTYTIDWTAKKIVWSIDGTAVRTLTPATADTDQYPQTPMVVKFGAWSGGDSSNTEGTISWAGGETDYSSGPYSMYVKSVSVTDYSTGTSYSYGDQSGDWTSIESKGGSIGSNEDSSSVATVSVASDYSTATSTNSVPAPFEGTHKQTSIYLTPTVYPWVAGSTTLTTSVNPSVTITNLPSGWHVTSSGKVVPNAGGSSQASASFTQSSPASRSASASSGPEVLTTTNSQGLTTTITKSKTSTPSITGSTLITSLASGTSGSSLGSSTSSAQAEAVTASGAMTSLPRNMLWTASAIIASMALSSMLI
ncbi:MAG: hypothetical protein M1834_008343 [Cirrosporium novae-zelandiae]|nr:MAG: hypothetical protein M1834_008343 [Cirrosporium novae-zelandiae]